MSDLVVIRGTIVGNECIRYSREVKNVEVWLDENLNLDKHINNIMSQCFQFLKNIGRVRNFLTNSHTEMLVHAVITSRLDYCNSLLINISSSKLFKLQKVQNAAARVVVRKRKRESVTNTLKKLHWLRVESRIIFKVLLLVFKAIHDNVLTIFKHYTTVQTVQLSPARCYDAGDKEREDEVREEDIQLCGTSAVECSSAPNQDRRKRCIV